MLLVLYGKMFYNENKNEDEWRNPAMPEDFEYKVRRKIEELSRSKEMENIKRDFKNMADDVKREFSSYCSEGRFNNEKNGRSGTWGSDPYQKKESADRYHAEKKHVSKSDYAQNNSNHYGSNQSKNTVKIQPYKTFSVSGVLFTVFGGIGLGIFTLFLLVTAWLTSIMQMFGTSFFVVAGILLVLIAVSGGMLAKGISLLNRSARLKKYLKIIGKGQFCPIDMLVQESGRDKAFILKDLQKMIQKKALPQAHLDDEKTCLMLTDEIYQQYRYVQQQAKQRQQEEERQRKEREEAQKAAMKAQQEREAQAMAKSPELAAAIRQGREMIEQIRRANDRIEGEEISNKMFRLEQIVDKIFSQVEDHPEKLPDIRRLMNYYLPTTLKLLNSYEEFDNQSIQGENIKTAKEQIEKTFDTINLAFENLLDQLFTDEVLDVSSDISVLETMLKQEGLMGSEFDQNVTRN